MNLNVIEPILNSEYFIIFLRLIFAAFLAGLIGMERELKHHPAGFRTHLLVGIGACLVMVLALYGFDPYMEGREDLITYDPSRLASYVISGVGFLGAGTIIVQGVSIRGLTTAASIWVVAAIGLTVGAGMYFVAFLTTVIVVLSLYSLNEVGKFLTRKPRNQEATIEVVCSQATLSCVLKQIGELNIELQKMKKLELEQDIHDACLFKLELKRKKGINKEQLFEHVQSCDGVSEVTIHGWKD